VFQRITYHIVLIIGLLLSLQTTYAQGGLGRLGDRFSRGGGGSGGGSDSLERRNKFEDSITIRFRYLDSTRYLMMDTTISDFNTRFPVPSTYHFLGNVGTAARPILFAPNQRVGFDPGFHAFDIYKWTIDRARFFTTSRPYTELGYVLGSQTHQTIEILHTQNFKPYWNVSLQYRLINSPGFFNNQRTNHNNYLFTSWYEAPNKRYNNYLVLVGNSLEAAENGGIRNDTNYLSDPQYDERLSVPTKIGFSGSNQFTRNPFGIELITGNSYKEFTAMMRQQYDLGRKDSIVTDSTVIPLFYPRVRFEHTLKYSSNKYRFQDLQTDSAFYKDYYNLDIPPGFQKDERDTLIISDTWKEISNDFSIYTFPDARNLQQFLKLGAELQLLNGRVKGGRETFANVIAHAEYRNRTRNQKWDMLAFGRLHGSGYNVGDYQAYISLQRLISQQIGSVQVGFENSSRSPSFIQDQRSNFYLDPAAISLNKENTTHLFAKVFNPALRLQLGADYYLIGNYLYYKNFFQIAQENNLFNVLRISALKTFKLSRRLNWYAEAYVQKKAGEANLNIPLLLMRHRIAFEGNFFKNLYLSTGLDIRYHTPFRGDHYSPVIGQFTYQDTVTIRNRPDIHAFFNFRIRSFKAYVRAENLNTLDFDGGFSFKRHNFAAPDYPYPGLVLRFGIFWSFVN
jgi:hypothetical protein